MPTSAGGGAGVTTTDLTDGVLTTVYAVVLALLGLYRRRLPFPQRRRDGWRFPNPTGSMAGVWGLQSGIVNDYITWMIFGLACLAAALTVAIR